MSKTEIIEVAEMLEDELTEEALTELSNGKGKDEEDE